MMLKDAIRELRNREPALFEKIPVGVSIQLIKHIFSEINGELADTGDGTVRVQGLGVFRVSSVEKETGGSKRPVKRILYRPRDTETSDA